MRQPYLSDFHKSRKELQGARIVFMYDAWTTKELGILYKSIKEYKSKSKITSFKEYFRIVVIPNKLVRKIPLELG